MATRVQWMATVPAGADADTNFNLGSVPEGKKLVISACSYWGGDAGERYSVNIVPVGIVAGVVDAANGTAQWLYPLAGGTQTVLDPLNVLCSISWPNDLPGPCSLMLSATAPSAAELGVVLLGYLEDL